MISAEEWRPIPGFPQYEISNLCRARHVRLGRVLEPFWARGYMYYGPCRPGGRTLPKRAHRLMWLAFHGEIPAGLEINHIDGDKRNNALSNLELATRRENAAHAQRLGLYASGDRHHARSRPEIIPRGSSHGRAKLTETDIPIILMRHQAGETKCAIARDYGVNAQAVRGIIQGKTWRHVTQQQPPR